MQTGEPLRVLVVEDSEDDSELILRELRRSGFEVTCRRVESREQMQLALQEADWDVVLSDYRMPEFDGLAALAVYREHGSDIPFLIISGSIGEVAAVNAMKAGVHDFFLKDRLVRLGSAVRRELREAENRRKHREAQRTLSEQARELATKNRELEDTANQLRRSNVELERFAYVAAHDLQEPLRSVAAYSEMLVRKHSAATLTQPDADEFLTYIRDGVDRMQQLISGLLKYSTVIHDTEHELVPVNTATLVDEVLRNLHGAIESSGAQIEVRDLPIVCAHGTQLTQVFQNLISNAIKYRKEGQVAEVTISAKTEKSATVFAIADNGIGIERNHWDRIFLLFKRLHSSNQYAGVGMGLAVVKRTVDRHGGRVWLDSEVGKGSTFYFSIPHRHLHE